MLPLSVSVQMVQQDAVYECVLSKDTRALAAEELREDEDTRDNALSHMKKWAEDNARIESCRTGQSSAHLGTSQVRLSVSSTIRLLVGLDPPLLTLPYYSNYIFPKSIVVGSDTINLFRPSNTRPDS